METKILFINDAYFKDNIPSYRNIDERKLNVSVKLVQDTMLPEIIGYPLYELLHENLLNNIPLTDEEKSLYAKVQLWLAVKVALDNTQEDDEGYLSLISKEKVLNSRLKRYIDTVASFEVYLREESLSDFNSDSPSQMNTFFYI